MNATRVQLPDGRLLTIEGGYADTTAALLRNHYLGNAQEREEPLELPSLESALTQGQHRQPNSAVHNVPQPVANDTEEEALALPRMAFGR